MVLELMKKMVRILNGKRVNGQTRGYGIMNVMKIKLNFGPEYGLGLNSMPGVGTIVRLYFHFAIILTVNSTVE